MSVNISKIAIAIVAFGVLAIIGGRFLAASVISRSVSRKIFSILGVLGCVITFIVILQATDLT